MPVHDPDFPPDGPAPLAVPAVTIAARLLATLLGLSIMMAGLWCALRVFGLVWETLLHPDPKGGPFREWAGLFAAPEMQMQINGAPLSVAPALAVLVLGGGTIILVWLTMGLMLTGAKVVAWTTTDREAVQRVLNHALGSTRRRT